MIRSLLPALVATSLLLSACGTAPKAPSSPPGPQLELSLASGSYSCEDGTRLQVNRSYQDRLNNQVHLHWNGVHYQLDRDASYSGLPRFEDRSSGLVWIDLPSKSVLLDGRNNKPLASDCRHI